MKTVKSTTIVRSYLASGLMLGALLGCSMPWSGPQRMHHAGVGESGRHHGQHGGDGTGIAPEGMRAMCSAVRDKLRSAKTPEERAAIMEEHMKHVSPEMRQRMHEHMHSRSNADRAQLCMQSG